MKRNQSNSNDNNKKTSGNTKKGARFLCKVAGVTFNNPDGKSRQDIIKEIINKEGRNGRYWTGRANLHVVKGESISPKYEGSVIEVYIKGKLIGYVPRNSTIEVAKNKKTQSCTAIVHLNYHPEYNMYTAKLYEQSRNKPTPRMEAAVRKILNEDKSLTPPEKTFDAYRQFLNEYKGGVTKQLRYKEIMSGY